MVHAKTKPPSQRDFTAMVDQVSSLVVDVQSALREALRDSLPALDGARACGRALGVSRGLGWSVYTVLTVSDMPTVLRGMPRRQGWNQIYPHLLRIGCDAKRVAALREAVDRLMSRLSAAGIDRMLVRAAAVGGLDTARETEAMLKSRYSMRRSAEEVLGIRAQAKIGTYVVGAPDRERRIDFVGIVEYEGLKRLRPGYPFPVHLRVQAWHPNWKGLKASSPLRVDPSIAGLVTDLSSQGVAETELQMGAGDKDRTVFFRGEGTLLGSGVRVVFAEHLRHGGTVGGDDDRAELDLAINEPVAFGIMEVWLHRSIALLSDPIAMLLGRFGVDVRLGDELGRLRLPLEAECAPIESPALPGKVRGERAMHEEIVRRSMEVLKGTLPDFVGYRVMVPSPPIGSRLMLKWRM